MTFLALASLVLAWLVGVVVVATLWPPERSTRADAALILPLGALVGLGVTSATFFAASLTSTQPAVTSTAFDLVLASALGWRLRHRRTPGGAPQNERPPAIAFSWLDWLLATVLVQAVVIGAIVVWRAYRAEPYGGWDAWAIWNLHARFMLRAGTDWPQALLQSQLSWSHPDYPWLVSASVARGWAWLGTDAPAASAAISVAFAAATLALLMAAVSHLRDRTTALLVGLLFVGTPFFLTFAPNQHADIPLGSLMLATAVSLVLGRHHALAGVCAGLAAWTKNEGLLFALIAAVAGTVQLWRTGERTRVSGFLAALFVGLLPVVVYKLALAPPNDLVSAPWGPRLEQLVDVGRHVTILDSLARDLRQFGEWTFTPYILMAVPFAAWRSRRSLSRHEHALPFILLALLAGYYGVYLLTPQDLAGHIDSSLVRLLLQLWPMALLGWALAVPTQRWSESPTHRVGITRTVFVGANALTAASLALLLSAQPAADELTAGKRNLRTPRVLLGEGWFGLERHGSDRWAWSDAHASLLFEPGLGTRATPHSLRFAVRSLGPRTLTIRFGGRIVWQRSVGDEFVDVVLPALALSPDTSSLELSTDTPGVREAPDAGARSLAFAVYNPRFD